MSTLVKRVQREREREREVLQRHIVCPSFSLDYIKSFMRNGTLYKTHLSPVLFQWYSLSGNVECMCCNIHVCPLYTYCGNNPGNMDIKQNICEQYCLVMCLRSNSRYRMKPILHGQLLYI